jgi:hypothetical protein
MPPIQFRIEVEKDHLERLAGGKPIPALAELIWNAVDADSHIVEVVIQRGEMAAGYITVRDDGHGIPYRDAPELFGRLGGSWKALARHSKARRRFLHGRDGKGRLKALALGRVADWSVVYRAGTGDLRAYSISIVGDDIRDVRLSEEKPAEPDARPGVTVRISELYSQLAGTDSDGLAQQLEETFALYLADYSDVQITVSGVRLDPAAQIARRTHIELPPIEAESNKTFPASLDVVEWKKPTGRVLYLCDERGMPLRPVDTRFHTPGYHFSAYLRSDYFESARTEGSLDLAELQAPFIAIREKALDAIRDLAAKSASDRERALVQQWQTEQVYPYKGKPSSPLEKVERQVFDVVAMQLHKHLPNFETVPRKTKAFHLRMLRQAIEKSPEDLQLILREVVDLPARDQRALAKLIRETSLGAIIKATTLVTDRLKFIAALEELVFQKDLKAVLKERTQLHRLLADNTWIFGEEFNLTVDDESLTQVLRKHLKAGGSPAIVDSPVKRGDGRKGIVDLMLTRALRTARAEELDHLVIELKAPSVVLGAPEIQQVKSYAFAVADDERFRDVKARWTFWVLSNEMDGTARREASQEGRPHGCIYASNEPEIRIWVKTWGQVVTENKGRLRFFQESLEHRVDQISALADLRDRYSDLLAGLPNLEDGDQSPGEPPDAAA